MSFQLANYADPASVAVGLNTYETDSDNRPMLSEDVVNVLETMDVTILSVPPSATLAPASRMSCEAGQCSWRYGPQCTQRIDRKNKIRMGTGINLP